DPIPVDEQQKQRRAGEVDVHGQKNSGVKQNGEWNEQPPRRDPKDAYPEQRFKEKRPDRQAPTKKRPRRNCHPEGTRTHAPIAENLSSNRRSSEPADSAEPQFACEREKIGEREDQLDERDRPSKLRRSNVAVSRGSRRKRK